MRHRIRFNLDLLCQINDERENEKHHPGRGGYKCTEQAQMIEHLGVCHRSACFSQRFQCQGYEPLVRPHCKSAINRLQSWASFAWMHDNAIHDSPFDA